MKKGIITEIDWEYIGAVFANEKDDEQVKFFKSMIKEMQLWPTYHQREMQLAFINSKLTDDEKEIISMLGFKED